MPLYRAFIPALITSTNRAFCGIDRGQNLFRGFTKGDVAVWHNKALTINDDN